MVKEKAVPDRCAADVRPLIGVSSCLLGAPVRYNGGHSRFRFLTDELDRYVGWVPVCPETEIGLGAPRETMHLERSEHGPRVIAGGSGADHTDELTRIADRHEPQLRRLDGYVLKNRSPSCGLFAIPVMDNGRRVDGKGRGAYASRLTERYPELPVEEKGRLQDAGLRERFVERVFAHARLRTLFERDWSARDLMSFQARHKMQLMAHSVEGARVLGRIAARAGAEDAESIQRDYGRGFRETMAAKPTAGQHVNALQHLFGMVGERLDDARRHDLHAAIDDYRRGEVPLSLPVALIRHHCAAEDDLGWVAEQTYLEPYPTGLRLRHALPG